MNQEKKCKILLLTGYLGAGKTTLLKYILKTQTDYQVAVIQNEFADEMGIEAPQMTDSNGDLFDSFFELPNGCICCSAKGQLMTAIEYFLEKKPNIQYIIIESNGLADPSNLIKQLWIDQGLQMPVELNAVIGLIPSNRFQELYKTDIFKKQIIFADLLLLNFKDLCQIEEIEFIKSQLKVINPSAKIVISERASIDLTTIFDINRLANTHIELEYDYTQCEQSEQIQRIFLKFTQTNFTVQAWNLLIGQILWEEEMNIMRIKGLLYCKDQHVLYSLQAVEDIFEIAETSVPIPNDLINLNKILIIGKEIDEKKIIQMLIGA